MKSRFTWTLATLTVLVGAGCAAKHPAPQTATLEEAQATETPSVETVSTAMPLGAGDRLGMHLFQEQDVASVRTPSTYADVRD